MPILAVMLLPKHRSWLIQALPYPFYREDFSRTALNPIAISLLQMDQWYTHLEP